jgi:Phage major capsid protein E.
MSGSTTKRMLSAYIQMAQPTLFLSGLFQSPMENFHSSEEVEIDIVRSDEDISIVIEDLSTGYRMNSEDLYTNKGFKPPIHKEALPINSFDLIKRMPGQDPFKSPDFRANIILRMFNGMTKIERKIRRAIEVQASQVLQTGKVTLTDSGGNALYTLDYQPKATHFPTAGTSWATATGAEKLEDINTLAEVIRDDGLADPDQLLMGVDAFESFISDEEVQKRFDIRRIDLGTIAPMQMRGNGGTFRGIVEIGNYRYDVWTYGGRYKNPQTGRKNTVPRPG